MNSTLATSLKSANLLPSAFADQSTLKNIIPATASGAENSASFAQGFPAITMQPVGAGGIPPSGYDMNGILYQMSTLQYLQQFGYNLNEFNATQSAAGYPKGAVVIYPSGNATSKNLYIALVDGTQALPTATSDWAQLSANPALSNITTQAVQPNGVANNSPDVVVKSFISADTTTWYRQYKSGWIEQGGRYYASGNNGSPTISLQIPMAVVLGISTSPTYARVDGDWDYTTVGLKSNPIGGVINSVTLYWGRNPQQNIFWEVKGY